MFELHVIIYVETILTVVVDFKISSRLKVGKII